MFPGTSFSDFHRSVMWWILILADLWSQILIPTMQVLLDFSDEELRLVHNTMRHNVLCCVAFTLTLVAMQRDARIDSDSILTFLLLGSCV